MQAILKQASLKKKMKTSLEKFKKNHMTTPEQRKRVWGTSSVSMFGPLGKK